MGMSPTDFYPPGPPSGGAALDQTARDAAAAAQATATAAVSTGAELAPLLATPEAGPPLSAKVRALGIASLADEAYGGKCDAVRLTGSIAAGGTTFTVPAGHGLTVGAGSPDIGKSFFLPKAGPARDGIATATYVSATTATLEKPAQYALAASDAGFMQSFWDPATGIQDFVREKRIGTVSVAAGSTALTDTGGGILPAGRLAYWLPGAWAETLIATISAVPSTTTITIGVAATVAVTSGAALVGTKDTVAFQAAINALKGTAAGRGMRLLVPRSCILEPVLIDDTIEITAGPNAKIWGIVQDSATVEKLFDVTGDNVAFDGLSIDGSYSPMRSNSNKNVIRSTGLATLVRECTITNFRTDDTNPSGGISGIIGSNGNDNQILVTHGIYLAGAKQKVLYNTIDNVSGAAVFTSNATAFEIEHNNVGLTMWYSLHADRGADDGWSISHNNCYTTYGMGRHYGGIVNLMSQIGGARNKNGKVIGNTLRGTCDYGSAIRCLSAEDVEIAGNTIRDIKPGAYSGGAIQHIAVDTRGGDAGVGDNGPCKRINVHDNLLVAADKNMIGIYCKNTEDPTHPMLARAAVEDVWVWNNIIKSPDASNYFDMGICIFGINGGFDRPRVYNNYVEVITRDTAVLSANSAIVGAISVLGSSDQGAVDNYEAWGNTVIDKGTKNAGANIGTSRQIGLNIIRYATNLRIRGPNRYVNFHVGVKVGSEAATPLAVGLSGLEGLTKLNIRLENCDTDMSLAGGPWDTVRTAVAVTFTNLHIGKTIHYTAGGLTQAPPALGLLGDGGWVKLKNSAVNPITVSMAGGNQTLAGGQIGVLSEEDGEVTFVAGNFAA